MLLITFSGLDGCGKSTHVNAAARFLEKHGYHVKLLTSHQISFSGLATTARDAMRKWHRRASPPREISTTGHAIRRLPGNRGFDEDRNRREVRLSRLIIYPVDVVILRVWLLIQRWRGTDAVVCDRYVFDKLVNLPHPIGTFGRSLVRLAPRADIAVLLAVPPEVCRARREEHPEDYYLSKHASYQQVATQFGMTIIANEDMERATKDITKALARAVEQSDGFRRAVQSDRGRRKS